MNFLSFLKQEELKATLWAKRHIAGALTVSFILGLFSAILWGALENYQLRKVQQQLDINNTQNKRLLNKQAEMTLTTERLRATNQALTESIRAQELNIREIERGLDFYRKLMDPAKVKEGLVLHNLSITPLSSESLQAESRSFKLHFTFVQYALKRNLMRANLKILLKGEADGQTKEIPFEKILITTLNTELQSELQQKLSFKFFQEFEQLITIPEDFKPLSLIIRATLKTSKNKQWAEEIPWPLAPAPKKNLHTVPQALNIN